MGIPANWMPRMQELSLQFFKKPLNQLDKNNESVQVFLLTVGIFSDYLSKKEPPVTDYTQLTKNDIADALGQSGFVKSMNPSAKNYEMQRNILQRILKYSNIIFGLVLKITDIDAPKNPVICTLCGSSAEYKSEFTLPNNSVLDKVFVCTSCGAYVNIDPETGVITDKFASYQLRMLKVEIESRLKEIENAIGALYHSADEEGPDSWVLKDHLDIMIRDIFEALCGWERKFSVCVASGNEQELAKAAAILRSLLGYVRRMSDEENVVSRDGFLENFNKAPKKAVEKFLAHWQATKGAK